MRLLVLLSVLISTTLAEDLIPTSGSSSFPACAIDCQTLQAAQTSCIPPAAPVTGHATYVSCFCQSALLTQLKTSASSICGSACTSQSDLSLLQTWYSDYCASGGTTSTTSSSTSTSTASSTGAASTNNSSVSSSSGPPTWWQGHWRWVLMVIVLAIGFGALTALGVYLRRRHHRKLDALAANKIATNQVSNAGVSAPNVWGPQQHEAHTRGWDSTNNAPTPPLSGPARDSYPSSSMSGGLGPARATK